MQFPEGFVEKYEAILEDEARDFLASFKQEAVSAFRVNPLKESQLSFADAIPHTPWGYYGKVSGKSPEHATGLVRLIFLVSRFMIVNRFKMPATTRTVLGIF